MPKLEILESRTKHKACRFCIRHATKKMWTSFEGWNNFKTNRSFTIFANLLFLWKNTYINLTGKGPNFEQGFRT